MSAVPDAEQYCEGCLAGGDQEHLGTCSVWLAMLQED